MTAYGYEGLTVLLWDEAGKRFLTWTWLCGLVESWGGFGSLVCHPATLPHASIPAEVRTGRGVDDALIRLSVGIEDVDDLEDDLRGALG